MAGAGAFQTPKARHGRCGLGAILGTVTCKDDEKWGTLKASVFPWKKTTQIYSDDWALPYNLGKSDMAKGNPPLFNGKIIETWI